MKNIGLLCIVILYLYGTAYAERTVWYVHPDSALNSIQTGLDSCADNDIVLVGPGTYYENIIWPNIQGIHLMSEFGPDQTIIDGDAVGRVITIASGVDSTTIIREFTIQNGYHTEFGSGIYCDSSSPIITGNTIRWNTTGWYMDPTYGGGICCKASSPIIRHNTITENYATASGAGIHCDSSSSPIIASNTIIENTLATFPPYGAGGGISCSFSSLTISNNTISDNWPEGIHCESSSSAIISSNIIADNSRYGIGFTGVGSPSVINNIITGNDYAGIHCWFNSSPIVDSCTISSNTGDGVWCRNGGSPTIHYCNIFDNENYGIRNLDTVLVDAEYNWWGDATGPYHLTANPGGLGDPVYGYIDFDPWLSWPLGVKERPIDKSVERKANLGATIFCGPLQLPEGNKCKVYDITGRIVKPDRIQPGIYFIKVDGVVIRKVVKVK